MVKKLILLLLVMACAASAASAQALNVATLRGVVSSVVSCDNLTIATPGPLTISLPSCSGVVPSACLEVTGQVSNDVTTGGAVISVVGRIWAILPAEECTGDY